MHGTASRQPSWLGPGLTIKGQISGAEDLQVECNVDGPISLGEHRLTGLIKPDRQRLVHLVQEQGQLSMLPGRPHYGGARCRGDARLPVHGAQRRKDGGARGLAAVVGAARQSAAANVRDDGSRSLSRER